MKNVKLVIWDLDETFWHGTLSEGNISIIQENIIILVELTNRGIMNTIVSKNDYDKAMDALKRLIPDKWDYFIFPSIGWTPKGERVKTLLKQIGILPENTVMIDDNIHNREEIKFYNPKINCIAPEELKSMINLPQFKGKDDQEHIRLNQYKSLERRADEMSKYSSNLEFLKSANIKIVINEDILSQFDRIYELIHRTNQLNYTKLRISKNELMKLLKDGEIKCAYIHAYDIYGDYGVCGFYALKENNLVHFLFSCRVLGMGIEQYVYASLGFPDIDVNGDVAISLNKNDKPTWITECDGKNIQSNNHVSKSKKVLFIGGCDLEQTSLYLEGNGIDIVKEFNTVIDGREYRSSDSCQLLNALFLEETIKKELCKRLPFYNEQITFATKMFGKIFDTIVYSVVDDYIRGIYVSKRNRELFVGYAGYFDQDQWLTKYPQEEFNWLFENFDYIGREPLDLFEKNLRLIAENIKDKHLVLINGPDIDLSDLIGEDRIQRNIEMNAVVDRVVSDYENIKLLDMRLLIQDRNDVISDNRHFKRHIYYKMSERLLKILNEE